jgi:deferrochelatase/peroxidase EfeB
MTDVLDLADIQGNVLRGYRMSNARHFLLEITDAASARLFVAAITPGSGAGNPQVTTAEAWDEKPPYTLNIALSYDGLAAIGVAPEVLEAFPNPFQRGPLDEFGGTADSEAPVAPAAAHAIVSLYTDEHRSPQMEEMTLQLRQMFDQFHLKEVLTRDARVLAHNRVHFGYRDGIAQPQIKGAPGRPIPDLQPEAEPGDFLLGRDYQNAFGGNYIGQIPGALGDNATYASFRIMRQDVRGFEEFLTRSAARTGLDRELLAAKLMGRWRNGTPLVLSPDTAEPQHPIDSQGINRYDYAPGSGHPAFYDDTEGFRCPLGAHTRRLNPRGALSVGKPHGHRLLRRGMPFGPPFHPDQPDDGEERGLVGYFICGDFETQYEFILRTWGNRDFATYGIRGTTDPFVGRQPPSGGSFKIRTAGINDPIVLTDLPQLVETQTEVYCFIPGVGGLRYLATLT